MHREDKNISTPYICYMTRYSPEPWTTRIISAASLRTPRLCGEDMIIKHTIRGSPRHDDTPDAMTDHY